MFVSFLIVASFFAQIYAKNLRSKSSTQWGVDVSAAITADVAACFKESGISYVIPRGYRSSGVVDSNVCTSLINAYNAGIESRDVYIFPCPTCSTSQEKQLSDMVDFISTNCKDQWSGRVWLDVEGSQYWLNDYTKNQEYYKGMVDACKGLNLTCGVYVTKHQWEDLFGSDSFSYGSDLPLWYAHYENTPNPSFSDFAPFGGWTSPYAKQYTGTTTKCGMSVDQDWSPNW